MWKKVGVVVVWVLAAVGTTSITLAAVSQVGGQVIEGAAAPIDSAEIAAARAAIAAGPEPVQPATPPTIGSSTTTSTVAWVDVGSASTAVSPVATTSAASPALVEPVQVTTTLEGGSITVQRSGSTLTLVSALPNSGYWVELDASGPTVISVEFESEVHDSYYEATVVDGELSIKTSEEADD